MMPIKKLIPIAAVALGLILLLLGVGLNQGAEGLREQAEAAWQKEQRQMADQVNRNGKAIDYQSLEASGWEILKTAPDGQLDYWTTTLPSTAFAYSQSFSLADSSTVQVLRWPASTHGSYRDCCLLGVPITFHAASDKLEQQVYQDLPFESYTVTGDRYKVFWYQYAALLGYLLLLAGLLWGISRKLKSRYAVVALLLTLLIALLVPVERLWSDLIMSQSMMDWLGWSVTLTDLMSITGVGIGAALLVSSKAIVLEMQRITAVVFGFLSSALLLLILRLAQGIVTHPSIQLEVTKIFRFDKYSIIVLICLAIMCISHLVACIYTWYDGRRRDEEARNAYLGYVLGGVLLSSVFYFWIDLNIPLLTIYLFMVSYYTMIDLFLDTQRRNVTWLIWWIMILSAFLAVSVFYISLLKGEQVRSAYVDDYLSHTPDSSQVQSLGQMMTQSGFFQLLEDLEDESLRLNRSDIVDYLVRKESEASQVKNLKIDGFNEDGASIFGDFGRSRRELKQQFRRAKALTPYIGYDYVCQCLVARYEVLIGEEKAVEIFASSGPIAQGGNDQAEPGFSYVLYKGRQPVYRHVQTEDAVDYAALLEAAGNNQKMRGYSYTRSTRDDFTMIAYSKMGSLIKPISLFSYLFLLIGLLTMVLAIANSRFRLMRPPLSLKFSSRSTLRNKIQLAVLLMVLFSFVAIGVLTAFYFRNVIQSTNAKTIREQSEAVAHHIASLNDQLGSAAPLSAVVANRLDELSFVHSVPMTLYDGSGRAIANASMPASSRMPFDLVQQQQPPAQRYAVDDVTYLPFDVKDGRVGAYLAIKHNNTMKTGRSLIDFLSTIVNVYVFLFLLGGAIAIIIANSITRPLADLGERLKSIKLGRSNERLEWQSNDEIGALIQDYNDLIVDLERSAEIIAMTERDTAWREMAKQVAHEIKNPLTPMKLSIQYLQRAGQSPQENAELIDRVSNTLIEQIDNLTQIANEFSNFAAMPMATNEKLLLNDIVEMIHELFRKREDMEIKLIEPITDLWVYADKNHLIRVLNNILKNAIQAIPDDRRGNILISLYQQESNAIVQVKDNGTGIPKDKQSKVFTPNFTTKSSGTGLGLAISVNMIEAFNGRIYFDTEEGVGTSFFVEIPLMRLDRKQDGVQRVILD